MDKIFIGNISSTHGIKGELKVRSNFKYKSEVFVENMNVYIDDESLTILSSRPHQEYILVLFNGYNNINDVLKFKGKDIYIDRSLINKNYILSEELIGFEVIYKDKILGKIDEIITNKAHEILVVNNIMIPYVEEFIKQIDFSKKQIYIVEIEGLIE